MEINGINSKSQIKINNRPKISNLNHRILLSKSQLFSNNKLIVQISLFKEIKK